MERFGLVLEGGGVRGAYTAGALTWLHEKGIRFDYGTGISVGALYLTCFETGNLAAAKNMAIEYASDKSNVGWRALLKEGFYVAYRHIFEDHLKAKEHLNVQSLKKENPDMEIGLYDLEKAEVVWYNASQIDDEMEVLLAACSLPIVSKIVDIDGHRFLDGGIIKMIPIERALEKGCTKNLVITTKPAGFVRKKGSKIVEWLMKFCYPTYPQLCEDYQIRHINYYEQMSLVEELVEKKEALLIRPTQTIPISRFKGNKENCAKLFELGYRDMEERKAEILSFLQLNEAANLQ